MSGATVPDITGLSSRARIAIALRIFADYCARRGLAHPEIASYLDHMWRFLAVANTGEEFRDWNSGEVKLIFAGLGEEYPPGIEKLLEARGVPESEFRQALCYTTEVLYGSIYAAADEPGSRRNLCELAALVARFGVVFPDVRPFLESRWSDGYGWGARPTPEESRAWRTPSDG